jgi:murein DD-endopeptidase MepM/ murein hydrolase activator NlpD
MVANVRGTQNVFRLVKPTPAVTARHDRRQSGWEKRMSGSRAAVGLGILVAITAASPARAGGVCMDWPLGDTFGGVRVPGYKTNIIRDFDVAAATSSGTRNHSGIDLQFYTGPWATAGAPVLAAASGVVRCTQSNYPGQVLVVEHTLPGGGYVYMMYGHINTTLTTGSYVVRGTQLGTVLNQSDKTHLHFEVRSFLWPTGQPNNPCAGDGYATSGNTALSQGWLNPVKYYFNNRKPFYPGSGVTSMGRTPYSSPTSTSTPLGGIHSIVAGTPVTLRGAQRDTSVTTDWWNQIDYGQGTAFIRAYYRGTPGTTNSELAVGEKYRICSDGCGNACTQCLIDLRPDILPFYRQNGWDTACWNRDAIMANWCSAAVAQTDCQRLKTTTSCASVCGSTATAAPLHDPGIESSPTDQSDDLEGYDDLDH